MLRALIEQHGLDRVFCEGLTTAGTQAYRAKANLLKSVEENDLPDLRKQWEEARQFLAERRAKGKAGTASYKKALAVEKGLVEFIEAHEEGLLEQGALACPR